MAFAFEKLQVYQRALDFAIDLIEIIDEIDAPRKHDRLIEQIEASSTSVASNISEGKGRYSKKDQVVLPGSSVSVGAAAMMR